MINFYFYRPRSARNEHEDAPQVYKKNKKIKLKISQKLVSKVSQKSIYIPYLDNIEITLMKIFVKTTEISGKISIFFLNGFLSVIDSTLAYDRILVGISIQERLVVSLGKVTIGRCNLIDTTHREVYRG